MPLDPKLLEILACPDDKGPLYYLPEGDAGGFLFCEQCRRRYEIRDDIPVMLIDEAETLSEGDAQAVMQRAADEGVEPTFDPSATA